MIDKFIDVSPQIREKISGMKLGIITADRISVSRNDNNFDTHFESLKEKLQKFFPDNRPSLNEIVGHVRRMYRRIGWEPTQYRPSSEALIRRILKGKGLYRINNLVDYGNLVSAGHFLPMGLYDWSKIKGKIILDVGNAGEEYDGISKAGIHAEGKLILRDDTGIFGNPTADSKRTSIIPDTNRVLVIFFCPPEIEDNYIDETLLALTRHYTRFSDGELKMDIAKY